MSKQYSARFILWYFKIKLYITQKLLSRLLKCNFLSFSQTWEFTR